MEKVLRSGPGVYKMKTSVCMKSFSTLVVLSRGLKWILFELAKSLSPKIFNSKASAHGILHMATWQSLQELQTGILAIFLVVNYKFMLSAPSKLVMGIKK